MKARIALAVIFFVTILTTLIIAQSTSYKLAWDYTDAELTSAQVTEFQVQYDGGAWTSVGIPTDVTPTTDGKTYAVPLNIAPGSHNVAVRACNVNLCSEPVGPLAYIKPGSGKNFRILGK